ncbi:MAG: hypothetical protein ABIK44_02610 [candidate division WOR-3 bacterium]
MWQNMVWAPGFPGARKSERFSFIILLAWCVLIAVGWGEPLGIEGWVSRFQTWHGHNEFRALASPNSANLAWFEANLLRSYLNLYEATSDTGWLGRFVLHADSVMALMRDFPEEGDYWPGYRDGLLGWGTTRYDPQGRYQEYLVHDAVISLPIARFVRMVYQNPGLQERFQAKARWYQERVEANIVAKWHRNWDAGRGRGEALEFFGGWHNLPLNQSLAFGELLLVLADVHKTPGQGAASGLVPGSFYAALPESMAELFYAGLRSESMVGAWVWNHWPITVPDPRPEDISHANLDISFAFEAQAHRLLFDNADLARFARTFVNLVWRRTADPMQFSRFVDGRGEPDSVLALEDWVRLACSDALIMELVSQAIAAVPVQRMNVSMASTSAQIAALTANRRLTVDGPQPNAGPRESEAFGVSIMGSSLVSRISGFEPLQLYDLSGRLWVLRSGVSLPQGVYFGLFETNGQTRLRPVAVVK